jgi:hypothetical protein
MLEIGQRLRKKNFFGTNLGIVTVNKLTKRLAILSDGIKIGIRSAYPCPDCGEVKVLYKVSGNNPNVFYYELIEETHRAERPTEISEG